MTAPGPGNGPVRPALPELLAPAGSPEALRAAIAAGADAVYLSGKRFGARKFAPNFSDGEITEGVRLAHARGVRVYVTVNTLIHDREIEGVADYLVWLYAAGVDAVLVQDIGVAALVREIVPDLPLHASTQMTVHNADGVLWAAEQGFSRVVLARELPLEEIRTIAERTRQSGAGLYRLHPHLVLAAISTFGLLARMAPALFPGGAGWSDIFSDKRFHNTRSVEVA